MKMRMEASVVKASPPDEKSKHKCRHCGKGGHRSEKCWKQFPELAPDWIQKRRNQAEPASAFIADDKDQGRDMSDDEFACLMARARKPNGGSAIHPWLTDSGCTSQMTFDRSAFSTYTEVTDDTVIVGTKQEAQIAGKGDIDMKVSVDGRPFKVKLKNALHVPSFGFQL